MSARDNQPESEDLSDAESEDEREEWSSTKYQFKEFPKEAGKTIFEVGKCAKFSFTVALKSGKQKYKLSLLSKCPFWIRNTSEIGDGEYGDTDYECGYDDDEADDDEEGPERNRKDKYHHLRGKRIKAWHKDDRPIVAIERREPRKAERSSFKLFLRYRNRKTCDRPGCCKSATTLPLITSVSTSLDGLFLSGDSSDAVFQVGNVEIPVHKVILSARYDYFKTLFGSEMKEALTDRVVIEDADAVVFKQILRFVYCGLPPSDLGTKATEYLPIADRYGMEDLKSACEASLKSLITSNTVFESFTLAQLYRCKSLEQHVRQHVSRKDKNHFKPSASLYRKAVDHFAIAERDGNIPLKDFSQTVFRKVLSGTNIYDALEAAQRHQCSQLVNEVLQYADMPGRNDDVCIKYEEVTKHLSIAHRDSNEDLRKVCSGLLKSQINVHNLAEIILLAHKNQCPGLKKACLRKLEESKDGMKEENFQALEEEPALMAEVKAVWDAIQLLQANRNQSLTCDGPS